MTLRQILAHFPGLAAADGWQFYVGAAGVLIAVAVLVAGLWLYRTGRYLRVLQDKHQRLIGLLTPQEPGLRLEEQLLPFLQSISNLVQAEYYGCYLFNPENHTYRLKALRQRDEGTTAIEMSYGRITSHQRDGYLPPMEFGFPHFPENATVDVSGEVSLLLLPIAEELGAIVVGPVKHCSKRQLDALQELCCLIRPLLQLALAEFSTQAAEVAVSRQSQPSAALAATKIQGQTGALLDLMIRLTRADGAWLLAENEQQPALWTIRGLNQSDAYQLQHDSPAKATILALTSLADLQQLGQQDPNYGILPPTVALLADEFLLLRLSLEQGPAALLLWGGHLLASEAAQQAALRYLAQRMAQVIAAESSLIKSSRWYLGYLRNLVTASEPPPYSVGHAELVARFALAIAKEMQLGEEECREVALAGLLHDLGVLSLPQQIRCKAKRYSAADYAEMQSHAAMGADLVEAMLANQQVAAFVRYHHEHWNGAGYPAGLAGEEIPLGARIIAVAEVFVAKLTGRENRAPLPFDQALTNLQAASGQQLDAAPVEALIRWYEKRRANLGNQKRALAPCFMMRCSPAEICTACPAYQLEDRNCWDIPGVACAAHGDTCASCLVHTEYLQRAEMR